jgi:hypothetical protein
MAAAARWVGLIIGVLAGVGASVGRATPVTIGKDGDAWILRREGAPLYLQGAVAPNRFELLRDCGANAVRTNATREALDAAHRAGLVVLANLPVRGERNGLDWGDPQQVAEQQARVLAVVRELKDHPAVLIWSLGNELDWIPPGTPYHPQLWQRLNDLARAVKALDPHHPVLTVVGDSTFEQKIQELVRDGPDFDLIGLNAYGALAHLAEMTRQYWPKPYLVTEWGPTGHWEVKKTPWNAPLEQTSTEKAQVITQRYQDVILADPAHCLGSFVFYWSEKQETTHTWYGLFLQGRRTESIDVMQHFWSGAWPVNRVPRIDGLAIAGHPDPLRIALRGGQSYSAEVRVTDHEGDPLTYQWDIRPEVEIPTNSYAGGGEKPAAPIPGLIRNASNTRVSFTAPTTPGAYRIFVTVSDAPDRVAYANLPFSVLFGE